jgi:SAM-dependent methyltransferase
MSRTFNSLIKTTGRIVLGKYGYQKVRALIRGMRALFGTWNLELVGVYDLVWFGPDQRQRERQFAKIIQRFARDPSKKCLQVGVPSDTNEKLGPNFTAIDLYDERPCIDVCADLAATPFTDASFDFIVCNAILEHVKDPFRCASEITRIAKPGAEIWIEVPFVQPYHPFKGWRHTMGLLPESWPQQFTADQNHGGDYWRFTPQGIQQLFPEFTCEAMLLADEGGIAFHGRKRVV